MSPGARGGRSSSTSGGERRATSAASAGSAVDQAGWYRSGGSGAVVSAETPTTRDDEPREDRPSTRPPSAPKPTSTSERSPELVPQRPRRHALRLEVEELSALVAGVADEREQEADRGEQRPR